MSSHRKRSHKHSSRHEDTGSSGGETSSSRSSKRQKTSSSDQNQMESVFSTLKAIQDAISKTNERISAIETNIESFPPNHMATENNDILSIQAEDDRDLDDDLYINDQEEAQSLLNSAIKPPSSAIKPPNSADKPPNSADKPQNVTTKSPNQGSGPPKPENTEVEDEMYDPGAALSSWEPSKVLSTFLDKHFRKKLSHDQVSEILDNFSVPSLDCLKVPSLDTSVVNQINSPQIKKFVQNRDKDLCLAQKALLNTTGPLCCLHDALSSGKEVSSDEVKNILEQALCLLGSSNYLLSTVRRKRVLATINKEKVNLADEALPNAKTMLFGEDFPTLASKQAELSRGLAKNLSAPSKNQQTNRKPSFKDNQRFRQTQSRGFSKYQNTRTKNYRPFRPSKGTNRESADS